MAGRIDVGDLEREVAVEREADARGVGLARRLPVAWCAPASRRARRRRRSARGAPPPRPSCPRARGRRWRAGPARRSPRWRRSRCESMRSVNQCTPSGEREAYSVLFGAGVPVEVDLGAEDGAAAGRAARSASVGSRPTGRPSIGGEIVRTLPVAVAALGVAQRARRQAIVVDDGVAVAAAGQVHEVGAGRPHRQIDDLRRSCATGGEGRGGAAQERAGDEGGERAHCANADGSAERGLRQSLSWGVPPEERATRARAADDVEHAARRHVDAQSQRPGVDDPQLRHAVGAGLDAGRRRIVHAPVGRVVDAQEVGARLRQREPELLARLAQHPRLARQRGGARAGRAERQERRGVGQLEGAEVARDRDLPQPAEAAAQKCRPRPCADSSRSAWTGRKT